jgi:hypothetical protein
MPDAYVCSFAAAPEVVFGSSSDLSSAELGLSCRRIEKPLPGSGPTSWSHWYKIVRLIETLPF